MALVEKSVMLQTMDRQWMEYRTQMEHFREGVGLRAYGQRDPLVEYKNEALERFNELRERIQSSIVAMIFHIQPAPRNTPPPTPQPVARRGMESGPGEHDGDGKSGRNGAPKPRRVAQVGAAP